MLEQKDSFNLNGIEFVSFPLYRADIKSVHEAILQLNALENVSISSVQEVKRVVSNVPDVLDIHTMLVAAIARWISGLYIQRELVHQADGASWAIRGLAPIVPCSTVDQDNTITLPATMIVNVLFGRYIARSADDLARIVRTITDIAIPSVQAPPEPDPERAERIRALERTHMDKVLNSTKELVVPKTDVRGDVIAGNTMVILRGISGATVDYKYGVLQPETFMVAMKCERMKRNLVMKLTKTTSADAYTCKLLTELIPGLSEGELQMSPGYTLRISRTGNVISGNVLGDSNRIISAKETADVREKDQPAYGAAMALDLAIAIMNDATSADNTLGAINLVFHNKDKAESKELADTTTLLPLYYKENEMTMDAVELYAFVGSVSPDRAPAPMYQSSDGHHYVDARSEDVVETKERLRQRLWKVDDQTFYNQKLSSAPHCMYALAILLPS